MSNSTPWTHAGLVAASCVATSLIAGAQSLTITSSRVICANDGQVPGLPAGVVFGGTSTFDNPVIDESGTLFFRARMSDPSGTNGVTALNDRALFIGKTPADLAIHARGSGPAPTLPGVTLNSGTSTQVGGSPRISPSGLVFWSAPLAGTGVVTTNDSALFGGDPANPIVLVREGDQCPGAAAGTLLSSTFSNLSQQPTGIQRAGRILFQSSTSGGDTNGTVNNSLWVTGTPGNLEQVQRKGDTVLGGAVISSLGFISQMNESGQVLHDETLSTTLGTTPATTANDKVLFVWTPGSGNALVLREGDAAPGTASATFSNPTNSWSVSAAANTFNRSAQAILNLELAGGDTTVGVNDRAVYVASPSATTMVIRKGDPTPAAGTTLLSVNNSSMNLTNQGRVAFQAALQGSVTTADDEVVLTGFPGSLVVAIREGDAVPGTVGAVVGSFISQFMTMNDAGQIALRADLTGGDTVPGTNSAAVLLWDPVQGMQLAWRGNDPVEVAPSVFKNSTTFGSIQFNNGDSSPIGFNVHGQLACRLNMADGSAAIVVIEGPDQVGSFCFGDGLGSTPTTPCPCGNTGAAGHGCANSVNAAGGLLTSHGQPFNDDLVLDGSGMPAVSTCIYLQGDAQDDATFGDGVRCVGGVLLRLRAVGCVNGASSFPDSTETITLSARGGVTPLSGVRRLYQAYYRNAAAAFCPPDTFNVTGGLDVIW